MENKNQEIVSVRSHERHLISTGEHGSPAPTPPRRQGLGKHACATAAECGAQREDQVFFSPYVGSHITTSLSVEEVVKRHS